MQHQLESQAEPAPGGGHLAEDLFSLLGVIKRGWRFLAACTAVCLVLGLTFAFRSKTSYQASARLLVLEQGGRLLPGGNGNSLQSIRGGEDSLSTQVMIIRSPIVIQQARMFIDQALKDEHKTISAEATVALKRLSVEGIIDRLTVTVPDASAKVLHVVYMAGVRDEAAEVIEAVIKSYEVFLQNSYQKNTHKTIELFHKAKDELSDRLAKMENDYKDYRKNSSPYTTDEGGRSIVARRLDQWEQVGNQARIRSLQLQSQLELGRKLASEGADAATLTAALSRLGSLMEVAVAADARSEEGNSVGVGYSQLDIQLEEVAFQKSTASRLLDHLRAERDEAVASGAASEEVARFFEAEPATVGLRSEIAKARERYESARRLARRDDPAVTKAQNQVKGLQSSLEELRRKRRPLIADQLARASTDDAIRAAEGQFRALAAREAALRETLAQNKRDRLDKARLERERLVKLNVPKDPRIVQVDELIARLEEKADFSPGKGKFQVEGLLGSIEQNLQAVETVRKRIQEQFELDMKEAKTAEVGLLAESNLRRDLERQRALFNSVVDQLDRAELVSDDYSSTTSQTINPPSVRESPPMRAVIVFAALVVGLVAGTGMAFVKDQLDTRIRSLTAMRRVLNISVLGIIPTLTREQREASGTLGLICHSLPRSFISEAYKSIRTNFEFLRRNLNAVVVLVTSPQSGDGKSTTASNLAISLAHAGRKVLLVDADLRNPTQHEIYGKGRERGLPHALKDILPLHLAIQPSQVENLDLLLAGLEVSNPAELLASHQLVQTLNDMRQAYDVVILDSPPLLAVADPSIIGQVVDGILLVVRTTFTSRPDVEQTVELLKTLKTPVLGAVINGITQEEMGIRYGGYGRSTIYGPYAYGISGETGENDPDEMAIPPGINGTVHH